MTALEAYELITRGGATDFARLIEVCASLPRLSSHLREQGFRIEEHPHTVNALAQASELRIQFTTDERYQAFLTRSVESQVLGIRVRIACLEDVARGKLWAYSDPRRRLSKRKKDELDLIRLAEAHPELKSLYPSGTAGATRPRMSGAVSRLRSRVSKRIEPGARPGPR